MLITKEIFLDYLHCKYKAYVKLKEGKEIKSEYEILQEELEERYKERALATLSSEFVTNTSTASRLLTQYVKQEKTSIINIPTLFRKNNKLSKFDKLLLTFDGYTIGNIQGKIPEYGEIIYGDTFKSCKVKINTLLSEVKKIIQEITILTEKSGSSPFTIKDFCRNCSFCKAFALEKDDLSLLKGMPTKEIIKYNSKGIFTVTQLSYTFRARKRSKRAPPRRNSLFSLKALAIREKKMYVFEKPVLPDSPIQIYLDIEGNEQNNFHYLIGLMVVGDGLEKRYSFWADNLSEEENIVKQLIAVCEQYENFTLFHYGSYEKQYLQRLKKKFPKKYDEIIDKILKNAINILSIIYLPTP